MLDVGLAGDYAAKLAGMPERVRAALSRKVNGLAAALQDKVRQQLSGAVLNARSGALAQSIVATIDDTSTTVSARVATSSDVKYAAILEYGGTIPPHQIVPDKARALAFAVGGKPVFAARINLPAITMPEHSYMRSSLADMAGIITDELRNTVIEAMQ
jgi:phage gpG-like protein